MWTIVFLKGDSRFEQFEATAETSRTGPLHVVQVNYASLNLTFILQLTGELKVKYLLSSRIVTQMCRALKFLQASGNASVLLHLAQVDLRCSADRDSGAGVLTSLAQHLCSPVFHLQ